LSNANAVYGKYLDEVFNLVFMSLNDHSFKNFIFQEVLLNLLEKTKQKYVLPKLVKWNIATTHFDLWMFQGAHDILKVD
jgi:hypothetical protein